VHDDSRYLKHVYFNRRYTTDWVTESPVQAEHSQHWRAVSVCGSLAQQQGVLHDIGGREDSGGACTAVR